MKVRKGEFSLRALTIWLAVAHALGHALIAVAGAKSGRAFWEVGWLMLVYLNTVPLVLTTVVLMALNDEQVELLPDLWRRRLYGLALVLPVMTGLVPVMIWTQLLR